jgi:hypothetical protein
MSAQPLLHITVPILLEKGEEKPEEKGSLLTCKIRSEPENPNSTTTHDMKIKVFKNGTTEEWLQAQSAFMLLVKSKALGGGKGQFSFARVFLKGDALFKFNLIAKERQIAEGSEAETPEELEKCFQKLTEQIMPRRALRNQKCYLSRIAKKPSDMKFRVYMSRMIELNDYLDKFPPKFNADQKYSKEQLLEFIEFGLPKAWQLKMVENNIDLSRDDATYETLIDFGERMELLEAQSRSQKMSTMSEMIPKKMKTAHKAGTSLVKFGYKNKVTQKKWCPYHKTDSHDANSCTVITSMANNMAQKKAEKDQKSSPTGSGKFDKKQYHMYQQFLHFQKMQAEQEKEASEEEADGSAMYFDLVEENTVKEPDESQESTDDSYDVDLDIDLGLDELAVMDE